MLVLVARLLCSNILQPPCGRNNNLITCIKRCIYTDIGTINTRLDCVQELTEKEVTTLVVCVYCLQCNVM